MKIKSIEFLLNHSGPVIQYRLRKEIIGNISAQEEKQLLDEIYELPHMQLIQKYVKSNGYIGSGMHSWNNWRGTVLHETPLQDGETAARLLCYYAIPKEHPIVENFVKAMRDEKIMKSDNQMHVKVKSRYYAPCFALVTPIRAFDPDYIHTINYRRVLTEIAMLGVGNQVDVIRESLEAISAATNREGVLKMNLAKPHNRRYSPMKIEYPTPYVDVRLEKSYKNDYGLDCDLTFWAVQFNKIVRENSQELFFKGSC